jgi:hypothetical protein
MEAIQSALATFGQRIGLASFGLSRSGAAQLSFDSGMLLSFEAIQDGLLICMHITPDQPLVAADWLLREVNLRQSNHAICVGLGPSDCVMLATRLSAAALNGAAIDAAVSVLLALSRRALGDHAV